MTFAEALQKYEGLRFVADEMEIMSAPGRVSLNTQLPATSNVGIRMMLEQTCRFYKLINLPEEKENLELLLHEFTGVRDITGTLNRLSQDETLDDVELFEIKGLAISSEKIRNTIAGWPVHDMTALMFPDLSEVLELLDPEHTGNTHFHIYDSYSEELADKRKALRALQLKPGHDEEEAVGLLAECMAIEAKVRERLSRNLRRYSSPLLQSLSCIGELDLSIAKARLAMKHDLVCPDVMRHDISYKGLRYLPTEAALKKKNRTFQPVDITLRRGVTLITGANMGGKTVTLKSLALAQIMAQYGFFVAAESATVTPVEGVLLSIGDSQSAANGLSSFGAEILRLDEILRKAEKEKMLVLIDEPARTTNPVEGNAIASAVIDLLDASPSICVVTSHYNDLSRRGTRLKVKGLPDNIPLMVAGASPAVLADLMDYSLVEDRGDGVDREALRIACLLGVSPGFAESIERKLKEGRESGKKL